MLYCQHATVAFNITMNPVINTSVSLVIYLFVCLFILYPCSSDGENGTDEKRKAGKSPTVSLQTPTSEMEYFDDRKKVDVAR